LLLIYFDTGKKTMSCLCELNENINYSLLSFAAA